MERVILIDQIDFAPYVDITSHVGAERIVPHIGNAQMMKIRTILGKELYADLLTKYENSGNVSLTEAYSKLHKALIPLLCYAAYEQYLPYSNITNTAFGLVVKKSQHSEPVDDKTLGKIINNVGHKVNFYRAELEVFLKENAADYPLYKQEGCNTKPKTGRNTIIAIR